LKISWKDRLEIEKVSKPIQMEYHITGDMINRQTKYAGHVVRGSCGLSPTGTVGQTDGNKVDAP
jgi:hypothetical protein